MSGKDELLRSEMIDAVYHGGAWFSTREDAYLKIAYDGSDGLMYARECVLDRSSDPDLDPDRDAAGDAQPAGEEPACRLRGGAYTFGTDWFDISFHGRLIDIYVDPDTLKYWDVRNDGEHGTYLNSADGPVSEGRLIEFCRRADSEVLETPAGGASAEHESDMPRADADDTPADARIGGARVFRIDGAGFAKELPPSEKKMGRSRSIFSIVDVRK